ncbi:MAG: hypothetical protein FJ387_14165 [Verrucomicrobia bacterium]|nr:hypothetical protein [Verrucomicrobiota bacterium]
MLRNRCAHPARGSALVVTLGESVDRPQESVGAKAAQLARLIGVGLPVPRGFCVTVRAFREFREASRGFSAMSADLARLSVKRLPEAARLSAQAVASLAATPLPPGLEAAVRSAWQALGEDQAYAVRSSATVEDAADHSFAGQFESCLDVRGLEALWAAIKTCWLSLYAERALIYQVKRGLSPETAAMAVIVQEMVHADAAGVLFTADPMSGSGGRLVIEAVPGLADALVSGKATPDRLVLERGTWRVLERASGTGARCLTEPLARRLGELGVAAERLFGEPQDLEWAAQGDRVFLLQSRPVTRRLPSPGPELEVWTNANAMEALPDVVTPMAWSLLQTLLQDFLNPLMRRLGIEVAPPPLVALIAGRAYLNLGLLRRLASRIGPVELEVASAFGGQYPNLRPAATPRRTVASRALALRGLVRALKIAGWSLQGLPRQSQRIERWGEGVFAGFALAPLPTLSDEDLARYPHTLLRLATVGEGERTWAAAVWMAVGGVGGSVALFKLARRWLHDHDGSLANCLLARAGNMDSAENGLALYRLAAWARERPALARALLAPGPFAELEARLRLVPFGPEFLNRWRAFLREHGHQARGGMDVAQPRWSEMPEGLLDMLRASLELAEAQDPIRLLDRRLEQQAQRVVDCRRRLRNPLKRAVLFALARLGQRGLRQREKVKNAGVRVVAEVRQAALEAGRRLTERGLLLEPREVFFLKLEELEPALSGRFAGDLRAAVAARRAQHARHDALTPPPVIVGSYQADHSPAPAFDPDQEVLWGLGVSPGVVIGRACVIRQADVGARVAPGEILVAPYTDPGWTPYFLSAAGIVVDIGGLLSHGSVVAREYGLPAVVNVGPATQIIRTGDRLEVNGALGRVTILERAPRNASCSSV